MATGHFIQAGATPSGTANDGYGQFVTVDRLDELERERVRQRIVDTRPELLADGAKTIRQKLDADAAMEELRIALHKIVGGDGVRAAMAMLTSMATKQVAVDAAKSVAAKAK